MDKEIRSQTSSEDCKWCGAKVVASKSVCNKCGRNQNRLLEYFHRIGILITVLGGVAAIAISMFQLKLTSQEKDKAFAASLRAEEALSSAEGASERAVRASADAEYASAKADKAALLASNALDKSANLAKKLRIANTRIEMASIQSKRLELKSKLRSELASASNRASELCICNDSQFEDKQYVKREMYSANLGSARIKKYEDVLDEMETLRMEIRKLESGM
ncbi:MAG: hypothetical protein CL579_17765 [Alteromonadaceae bacterium]|nr:hypothetical protein [Alteromonadaceae bacterium]